MANFAKQMIVLVRSESYITNKLHRDSLAQYRLSYDESYNPSCILHLYTQDKRIEAANTSRTVVVIS